MQVSQAMTRNVKIARPEQTIQQAAKMMAEIDAGLLPVGNDDQLLGMITDRDIAVRAVAEGKGPQTSVREVMTRDVKYCFEDEDIAQVARNMAHEQVRRLPVVNRDKRLVGILSLADVAISKTGDGTAASALQGIARPGGKHSQAQA
jgi:CBS domain-containing protein